uniref:putative ferric-chelate reductase 1 n=1 Tax=Ciona intestinalis TaxID=7719 RepID=UPI000180C58F|nr:putative ferric-chelate reductase 1 [Ciona intestinalis]|eukprot:XP_002121143.1 putative ferric-chelate reductase 1 [Ciona intestinalis]
MQNNLWIAICIICTYREAVYALPGGAPTGACTTMMPRHNNGANGFLASQSLASSPYTLMASKRNYNSTEAITVWVVDSRASSDRGYRGLLLQARKVSSSAPVGTWMNVPANTKLITCSVANDAVTHSNTMVKNESSVYTWKAGGNHGNIEFVITTAQSRSTFWVQQKSGMLMHSSASVSTSTTFSLLFGILCMAIFTM